MAANLTTELEREQWYCTANLCYNFSSNRQFNYDFLLSFYVCYLGVRTVTRHAGSITSFKWFGEKFVYWHNQLELRFWQCLKVGTINCFGEKRWKIPGSDKISFQYWSLWAIEHMNYFMLVWIVNLTCAIFFFCSKRDNNLMNGKMLQTNFFEA